MRNRKSAQLLMVMATIALSAQAASAQWSALQQTLFRDIGFGLNPNVLSFPQGGPLSNFNNFYQRVEFDRIGKGYTYEFFRFFGPDTFGDQNVIDLGGFTLSLSPDAALGQSQSTGIHGEAGFTTRFIPEFHFTAETGQRVLNQFSGISAFNKEPIRYEATLDTGFEELQWTGNMQVDANGTINALGFYDFNMRLVNVGNFTADGVLLEDEQVTDFDTGPVNLSGNIAMDALASLLQFNGNALSAAPPRIFSAAAQKERTADELVTALKSGEKLTDEEVQFMIEQLFVQAFMNDPIGFIMNGPPATLPGFDGLSLEMMPDAQNTDLPADPELTQVPEPGTLMLIGVTVSVILFIRKRGGLAQLAYPSV